MRSARRESKTSRSRRSERKRESETKHVGGPNGIDHDFELKCLVSTVSANCDRNGRGWRSARSSVERSNSCGSGHTLQTEQSMSSWFRPTNQKRGDMGKPSGATKEAMGLLADGLQGLSSNARDFVRRRSQEARLAVAVALETAAAQCEAAGVASGSAANPAKHMKLRMAESCRNDVMCREQCHVNVAMPYDLCQASRPLRTRAGA